VFDPNGLMQVLRGGVVLPYNNICKRDIMKRIESEIERIMMLRGGASGLDELALLRSFGGAGTLVVVLQCFAGVWGGGTVVTG